MCGASHFLREEFRTVCPLLHSVHIASLSDTSLTSLGKLKPAGIRVLFLWYLQYIHNSTRQMVRDHNPIYCKSGYKMC